MGTIKLHIDGAIHNHICGMFRVSEKQSRNLVDFVWKGLEAKEKLLAIGPNQWLVALVRLVEAKHSQIKESIDSQKMRLMSQEEIYLAGGEFSAGRTLTWLENQYQQALSDGFQGLRVIEEMSWSAKNPNFWEELFTYEARLNEVVKDKNLKCYCVYDPVQFRSKQLYRAMLTHPALENENYNGFCPTFIPPEDYIEEQRMRYFANAVMQSPGQPVVLVEEKRKERKESLTGQILDQIKEGVLAVDAEGRFSYMNQTARMKYGDQLNRICHESVFKNVNPCPVCQLLKLIKQGRDRVEFEIQDERGAHISLCAYTLGQGTELESIVMLLRDVTQRKKWEEESAFMDKFSSIGYLASGIAHELNNNLTPILICSQILCQAELSESLRERAKRIETCTIASKKLVDSLLDFSQKIPNKKDFANLNQSIQKIIDLMEYRLSKANIEVKLNLDVSLPNILVDELKIQQVFSNLITNAYQSMQETGGNISITSSHAKGWCRFEISDSGPGIPSEIRTKIFDPFFTTRQIGEGKGLGLSTSFGIIAAHQGKISFESRENQGTTFVVEIPVLSPAETGIPESSVKPPALEMALSR